MSASPQELLAGLQGEHHVALTTFRRSGLGVATPIWFAAFEGRIYMRTLALSGKVKRIRGDGVCTLAACTKEGQRTGPAILGRARVLADDDALVAAADQVLQDKYGDERSAMTAMMKEQAQPLLFLEVALGRF